MRRGIVSALPPKPLPSANMTSDDPGLEYDGPVPARRVVSLVPSITEALATSRPEALVGATGWCTHPADLSVTRPRHQEP